MSVPGRGDDGYILLDVLVALFVVMIGFGAVFAGIKTAIDYSVRSSDQLAEGIGRRNDAANEFTTEISFR